MLFQDRTDAGRQLAAKLAAYAGRPDVLVLARPRGGVPMAYEVAGALERGGRGRLRSHAGALPRGRRLVRGLLPDDRRGSARAARPGRGRGQGRQSQGQGTVTPACPGEKEY